MKNKLMLSLLFVSPMATYAMETGGDAVTAELELLEQGEVQNKGPLAAIMQASGAKNEDELALALKARLPHLNQTKNALLIAGLKRIAAERADHSNQVQNLFVVKRAAVDVEAAVPGATEQPAKSSAEETTINILNGIIQVLAEGNANGTNEKIVKAGCGLFQSCCGKKK